MPEKTSYVLGESNRAAQRLDIQDRHFAEPSEWLLNQLPILPGDRVVELGCGPGGFTRRILQRLGGDGIVVGVDTTAGLLDQAVANLSNFGPAKFQPVLADIGQLGDWLEGADVVVGRAVLHHLPMAEYLLGKLLHRLRPGTRIGFIEPDFRTPLVRLACLEAAGQPELVPLRIWSTALNQLYQARQISPAVGATLAPAIEVAGYRQIQSRWTPFPTDGPMIENMAMFYDEVRLRLEALHLLTSDEVNAQQVLLRNLPPGPHPATWGVHAVVAKV